MDASDWEFVMPDPSPSGSDGSDLGSTLQASWREQLDRVGLSNDYIDLNELQTAGESGGWESTSLQRLSDAIAHADLRFQAVAALGCRDYGRGDVDSPAVASVFVSSEDRLFKVLALAAPASNGSGINACWPLTMVRELQDRDDVGGAMMVGLGQLYVWDPSYSASTAFWHETSSYSAYVEQAHGLANPGAPYWQPGSSSAEESAVVTWVEIIGRTIASVVPLLGAKEINQASVLVQSVLSECLKNAHEDLNSCLR